MGSVAQSEGQAWTTGRGRAARGRRRLCLERRTSPKYCHLTFDKSSCHLGGCSGSYLQLQPRRLCGRSSLPADAQRMAMAEGGGGRRRKGEAAAASCGGALMGSPRLLPRAQGAHGGCSRGLAGSSSPATWLANDRARVLLNNSPVRAPCKTSGGRTRHFSSHIARGGLRLEFGATASWRSKQRRRAAAGGSGGNQQDPALRACKTVLDKIRRAQTCGRFIAAYSYRRRAEQPPKGRCIAAHGRRRPSYAASRK